MSDYTVRVLRPDEHRAAAQLFRATLHVSGLTDEEWGYVEHAFQPGRTLGAYAVAGRSSPQTALPSEGSTPGLRLGGRPPERSAFRGFDPRTPTGGKPPDPLGGELIGTARSFDADVTVPGGNRVPMAAVTGVGVRANRTRRGVLTELMRTQLRELHTRGVPVAMLYASEGRIYGRFGYGIATRTRDYRVDRRRAVLRPEVPTGGEIDLLGVDGIFERLPRIYDALPHTRPGMMTRPPYWWAAFERHARKAENPIVAAVHNGPDGPDGFVVYTTERSRHGDPGVLDVISMHAANAETFAGLWRYLLGVDLVDVIRLEGRPADEPTALLFTDARMCAPIAGEDDDAWLRLVDVPAALAAREYEGESVVIEVVDPVLEANSGRYLVSSGQVVRTGEPAGFRLGVDALAMLYFGAWRASALADTGWIQPIDPSSVARADRLFSTRVAAWCGTHF